MYRKQPRKCQFQEQKPSEISQLQGWITCFYEEKVITKESVDNITLNMNPCMHMWRPNINVEHHPWLYKHRLFIYLTFVCPCDTHAGEQMCLHMWVHYMQACGRGSQSIMTNAFFTVSCNVFMKTGSLSEPDLINLYCI